MFCPRERAMSDPFPDEIDSALWNEAGRRADAIRGFLKRHPGIATAADVSRLAAELGLSRATAYRLIKLFRAGGTVLSLVDRNRGRPQGHRVLDDKREETIRAAINAHYLKRTVTAACGFLSTRTETKESSSGIMAWTIAQKSGR
jgi:putative transposase